MRSLHVIIGLLVLLASCARPVAPTGGDRDVEPPKLITDRSTANYQTHFRGRELNITFDEWVVIDKLQQTLIVSPPLPHRPKITLKGKTLHIKIDDRDSLRPNTTYIFDLSGGVQDLNEGNVLEDLKYVFSTGAVLDSFQLDATVVNAADKKPAENAVVMLYRADSDSLIYKSLPDYAGRTGKDGRTQLTHLRAGNYKVYALLDLNQNYLYDLTDEAAGFVTERVDIPGTTSVNLSLFKKSVPSRISQVDSSSVSKLRLVAEPGTAGWQVMPYGLHPPARVIIQHKYIDVFYPDSSGHLSFIVTKPGVKADTFQISKKLTGLRTPVFSLSDEKDSRLFIPQEPVRILFNNLLSDLDSTLITVHKQNSTAQLPYTATINPDDHRMLLITGPWQADSMYEARIMPGALRDIRGKTNTTLLSPRFTIANPEVLGSISVRIDSLEPTYQYLISLVKGEAIFGEWSISGSNVFVAERANLTAGTYDLLIIEDINNNGRQDGGSFDDQVPPERLLKRSLEPLRENWSVEALINMHEFD